jgi:hypothetical protein
MLSRNDGYCEYGILFYMNIAVMHYLPVLRCTSYGLRKNDAFACQDRVRFQKIERKHGNNYQGKDDC